MTTLALQRPAKKDNAMRNFIVAVLASFAVTAAACALAALAVWDWSHLGIQGAVSLHDLPVFWIPG
jgi:hypothetical protein